MNARENLVVAYADWERWTQREGLAIQEENWHQVTQCQKAKLELQGRIISLTDAANAERAEAGLNRNDFEPNIRRIVNGLIALETRNAELLSGRRQEAAARMAELDQAAGNLRRVQESYGRASQTAWHSYS